MAIILVEILDLGLKSIVACVTMSQSMKAGKTPQLDVDRVREALVAFYAEHNPERMTNIDPILDKYCGYEVELLKSLKEKYNVTNHPLIDGLLSSYVISDTSYPESSVDSTPQPVDSVNNAETNTSSTFAGLSSIGLTNAAGRLLSGVSWGLNNESFAFAPVSSESDTSSGTKLFKMQAEIDRLEMEKASLDSKVKTLTAQIAAASETSLETKELDLKEKMVDITNRLLAQLESLNMGKSETHSCSEAPFSHILDSTRKALESRSHEQLISEILFVRDLLEILRIFVMDIITKNLVDINSPDRGFIKDKLVFFCQKVGIDWSNLDNARDQAFVLQKELERAHELLAGKEAELSQSAKTIESLQEEIKMAKEYIAVSNVARQQISTLCSGRVRQAEISTHEHVQQQTQALLLEREEVLSNLAHVGILQEHWQVEISNEQMREIARLRDELTKSRRQEAQREREVTFLQRQLQEAANRLARFEESDNSS